MNKGKKLVFWMKLLLGLFSLVCFGIFSFSLYQVNVVPALYLVVGLVLTILFYFLFLFILFRKKNVWIKGIAVFVLGGFSCLLLYCTTYFDATYLFFRNMQKRDYDVLTYYVIVEKNKDFSFQDQYKIAYLDDDYQNIVVEKLNARFSYVASPANDFGTLAKDLIERRVDAICLEESYLQLIGDEISDFRELTTIVYTFEVEVDSHQENNDSSSFSEPFVLYISGIDQYGNVNRVRGRSDVNQIAVVNPKTRHILLVNTPRDYYVQLAGTTGLKDKLTHAGIYGIGKSIATLENLYGIDIDSYLRVNFDSLIQTVDVIGGIDIYSDASFSCWTDRSVFVQKGWNHFNGRQALAYSRERHAYSTGDHHRGANQQQVITAILNKVSQSRVLIGKYSEILKALDGSFQTDLSIDVLSFLVREQFNRMEPWNIESIAVRGYNSKNYTYSMGGNHLLYVMIPDEDSILLAANRIREVLEEGK